MDIPAFETKKELFDFLVTNKDKLISAKKAAIKKGDDVPYISIAGVTDVIQNKAVNDNSDVIKVLAIINTTNILDSHKDVHIPGIWNQSVKNNKNILHLQEHELKFDHIIAEGDDLKVFTKDYTWGELGFNYTGKTEALVFESTVRKSANPFMFERYRDKKVKNHSVGMIYIKMALAINSDEYGAEKEVWDKYYPDIVNKADADPEGYFWAIKEAKIIEGSAVPIGSNPATPTLEPKQFIPEPIEPSNDTQQLKQIIINEFKKLK
jgi:hypothetical protein